MSARSFAKDVSPVLATDPEVYGPIVASGWDREEVVIDTRGKLRTLFVAYTRDVVESSPETGIVYVDPTTGRSISKMSDITSIAQMRDGLGESLVLSFDTEFFKEGERRLILSYQFAFYGVVPGVRHEVIIAPTDRRPTFSDILSWLFARYQLWDMPFCKFGRDGFPYSESRRWFLPYASGCHVKMRTFKTLDEARRFAERHSDVYYVPFKERLGDDFTRLDPVAFDRKLLVGAKTPDKKAIRKLFAVDGGRLVRSQDSHDVVGDSTDDPTPIPIGYCNDYHEVDRLAFPVTLLAHAQSADLTALGIDDFERDMLIHVAQVQGGLVSLKPMTPVHVARVDDGRRHVRTRYWRFYPIRTAVRDSKPHAPAGKSTLAALGEVVDVPKLEMDEDDTRAVADVLGVEVPREQRDREELVKGHMDILLRERPVKFVEYASEDTHVALAYEQELWGTNVRPPVTLIAAATRQAKQVMDAYFAATTEEYAWHDDPDDVDKDAPGFDEVYRGLHEVSRGLVLSPDRSAYIEDTRLEPVSSDAMLLQTFAEKAYCGGKNESEAIGFYDDVNTLDQDLESAYPGMMASVPDVDWLHPDGCIVASVERRMLTPQDLPQGPVTLFFAEVAFDFPDDCLYPCIPVRCGSSLVNPRHVDAEHAVYAAAPELYLALCLRADVYVLRGYMGRIKYEWDGDGTTFRVSHSLFECERALVADRNLAKAAFGEKSLPDLELKTGGNGIYGKTAQDVVEKHTWDAYHDEMVNIGGSPITSPVHATMITSGVRAVLLAAMNGLHAENELHDKDYHTYSVTTDGFITNVPLDELSSLALYGFTRIFQESRMRLVGDPTMWAAKHHQSRLLNFTTRGNVGLEEYSVCAHNSYRSKYIKESFEDRAVLMDAVLSRTGRVLNPVKRWVGFRDLASRDRRRDFGTFIDERHLHMDFDLKRKPVRDSIHDVTVVMDDDAFEDVDHYKICHHDDEAFGPVTSMGCYFAEVVGKPYPVTYTIANFETEPFDSIEEYEQYRQVADAMRNVGGCLRTKADWDRFYLRLASAQSTSKVSRRGCDDMEWKCLFAVVCGHFRGRWHIPTLDDTSLKVDERIEWLNGFLPTSERTFNRHNWKDAHKPKRDPRLPVSTLKALLDEMGCDWYDEMTAEELGL